MVQHIGEGLVLRGRRHGPSSPLPGTRVGPAALADDEESLRCSLCQLAITSPAAAVSRRDRHQHTFCNPMGLVFEIACYAAAPGCLVHGQPSNEFCWFEGYVWQLGACRRCHAHLGWHFSAGDDAFFGLIRDRLR
ncbi:MAG: hypothetical protein BWK76_05675 [Desulfobulbaceae bacterium A2]|nr:MAG: hypothetical protein BWK76_05675 [Desulfobulbaceae bacterium A2]